MGDVASDLTLGHRAAHEPSGFAIIIGRELREVDFTPVKCVYADRVDLRPVQFGLRAVQPLGGGGEIDDESLGALRHGFDLIPVGPGDGNRFLRVKLWGWVDRAASF